jgi:hypothetical protein
MVKLLKPQCFFLCKENFSHLVSFLILPMFTVKVFAKPLTLKFTWTSSQLFFYRPVVSDSIFFLFLVQHFFQAGKWTHESFRFFVCFLLLLFRCATTDKNVFIASRICLLDYTSAILLFFCQPKWKFLSQACFVGDDATVAELMLSNIWEMHCRAQGCQICLGAIYQKGSKYTNWP